MLVVEDRDGPSGGRHHAADLLHEEFTGKQLLLFFVPGVIAMLTDQQHTIHRQFLSAQCQRFDDAGIDRHLVLRSDRQAHVLVGYLVDVHRHEVDPRLEESFVRREPLEELRDCYVRVRMGEVFSDDSGDLFAVGWVHGKNAQ